MDGTGDKTWESDTASRPFYDSCAGIIPTLVGTILLFSRSAGCKKTTEEVVIRKWGRLIPSLSISKYSTQNNSQLTQNGENLVVDAIASLAFLPRSVGQSVTDTFRF